MPAITVYCCNAKGRGHGALLRGEAFMLPRAWAVRFCRIVMAFASRLSYLVGQGGRESGRGSCAAARKKTLRPLCLPRDQLFCRRRYSLANSTRAGSTEMKMIMRITREKFCLTKARLPKK